MLYLYDVIKWCESYEICKNYNYIIVDILMLSFVIK
jgi:hypothetical protein